MLSEDYETQKIQLFVKLLTTMRGTPVQTATLDIETLQPHVPLKRRVGRPRHNWVLLTAEAYWLKIVSEFDTTYRFTMLTLDSPVHRALILRAAQSNFLGPKLIYVKPENLP